MELRDGSAWRIWPGDIPKTLQWLADDGDRRRGHRRRNLFARAGRSLERVTGASDKRERAMARRRCAALPPPRLSSRHVCEADVSGSALLCAPGLDLRSDRKKFLLAFISNRRLPWCRWSRSSPDCATRWEGQLSCSDRASERLHVPPAADAARPTRGGDQCLTLDTSSSRTRANG